MCDENKEKRKKRLPIKNILMTATTSSECYTTVDQPMKMKLTTMKLHETRALLVE